MKIAETLKKLESLGSAQTRKTYGRHGVSGAMFGVKYGDLYKLVKCIGVDHELALALWASDNHDARILAIMIADPELLTGKVLSAWVKAVDNHVLCSAVAGIGARSSAGRKQMRKWMAAAAEWPAATGWMMLSGACAVTEASELTIDVGRELLAIIEAKIHAGKNRVKYSMNTALIALGTYVPGLEAEAVAAADRIGKVEVDHFPSYFPPALLLCKTPTPLPTLLMFADSPQLQSAPGIASWLTKIAGQVTIWRHHLVY